MIKRDEAYEQYTYDVFELITEHYWDQNGFGEFCGSEKCQSILLDNYGQFTDPKETNVTVKSVSMQIRSAWETYLETK